VRFSSSIHGCHGNQLIFTHYLPLIVFVRLRWLYHPPVNNCSVLYLCDAMLAWYTLWPYLSVCLFVTSESSVKMDKHTTLPDSLGTLIFWCQRSVWNSNDRRRQIHTCRVAKTFDFRHVTCQSLQLCTTCNNNCHSLELYICWSFLTEVTTIILANSIMYQHCR